MAMLTRMLSGKKCHRYKHGASDATVIHDPHFEHDATKEMDFILSCDKIPSACGDECYFISSAWIKRWMEYGKGKAPLQSVGSIDNNHLVECKDSSGTKTENMIRLDIESKVDYRCVNKVMWEYLFRAYGGGPVIGFYIPIGMKTVDLKSKVWMKYIVVERIPTVLTPTTDASAPILNIAPPYDLGYRDDILVKKHAREDSNLVKQEVVNTMIQEVGQSKLKEAEAITEDVQHVAVKACLMALTKNAKKLEARAKMRRAKTCLFREEEEYDGDDRTVMEHMLRQGAGLYLQLALKDLFLQKKTHDLKERQSQLRSEGAILVLQGAWRKRQARLKRSVLLRERMEDAAALRLQGYYRCRLARHKICNLRQTLKIAKACMTIQRSYRSMQGRRKLAEMLNSFHPHNLVATIESATFSNLLVMCKNPQDRCVVATVFALNSRSRGLTQARQEVATGLKGAKKKRTSITTFNPTNKSDNMTMLSFHRSGKAVEDGPANKCKWIAPPTNPSQNICLMTNATPTSMLVFSVFEKQTFLGQACVDIQEYARRLYAGENVQLKDLTLHTKGAVPIHDTEHAKDIINTSPLFGSYNTGTLTINIHMPTLTRSMSGWVQRTSSTFLHGGEFKRRWMIMMKQKLLCFDDPYTLNNSKGEIDLTQVYDIKLNKATKDIEVYFGAGGKSMWTIKWDEDEADHLQSMWHRKFKRCLPPGIKMNDFVLKKRKETL